MEKLKLSRSWNMFLDMISEDDMERKYLSKIMKKQYKKLENLNKRILQELLNNKHQNISDEMEDSKLDSIELLVPIKSKRAINKMMDFFSNILEKKKDEIISESISQQTPSQTTTHKQKQTINQEKHKKLKFKTFLNLKGDFYKKNKRLKKNFFQDLNYGDIVLVFQNSEGSVNHRIDLNKTNTFKHCMNNFIENINIHSDLQKLERDYLLDERKAFMNALWFFSTDFYSKKEQLTKTDDNLLLENPDEADLYMHFNIIVNQWRVKSKEDFELLRREKVLYKERILIKFLKVCLQQKKPQKNPKFIKKFRTQLEKLFQKQCQEENQQQSIKNFKSFYQNDKDIKRKLDKMEQKFVDVCLFQPTPEFQKSRNLLKILTPHYDFIFRKIILLKLIQLDVHYQMFKSEDFTKIFIVLKIQESSLRQRAEQRQMNKPFELGLLDFISYDPLDSLNRPFRMKDVNFKEHQKEQKKKLPDQFENNQNTARIEFDNLKVIGSNPKNLNKLINQIMDLNVYDSYNFFKIKQIEFKGFIDKILKKTQTDLSSNIIIKDCTEGKVEWAAYIVYTMLFKYFSSGLFKLQKLDNFSQYEGLIYRLIALQALKTTNKAFASFFLVKNLGKKTKYVKTLWDELNLKNSIYPHVPFTNNKKIDRYWKTFQTNELGDRSIFLQKERIQMLHNILTSSFRIDDMVRNGQIIEYFPLHDDFVLLFQPKLQYFTHLLNVEKIISPNFQQQQKKILAFLELLWNNSDDSDFLERSLIDDLKINLKMPWEIAIDPIRDYFGERVGIYFEFLSFYNKYKLFMAIVGVIIYILQQVFLSQENALGYKITTLVYASFILLWAIFLTEHWKRREALFAIKYGQNHQKNLNVQTIRSGFKGTYIRDKATNFMNYLFYSSSKRKNKYILTFSISFFIIILSVATSIAILLWKRTFDPTDVFMNYFATGVNAIQIIVFELIYYRLSFKFTDYENHQSQQNYRDSLILKLYFFNFFNTFNSFLLISFLKPYSDFLGACVVVTDNVLNGIDCFNELSIQLQFVYILKLILSFVPIIILFLKAKYRKIMKKMKKIKKMRSYQGQILDRKIESEFEKDQYITTQQVDGTLLDMLIVMTGFSFLCLFSISFPLSYIFAFFGGLLTQYFDKVKMIHYLKRPMPESVGNLGLWRTIMEVILYLTIFCNAAIFSFTLEGISVESNRGHQLNMFLLITLLFFFIKMVAQNIIGDVPENFKVILQRQLRIKRGVLNEEFAKRSINLRAGIFLRLNQNNYEDFLN